jgi:hypothetical protein
MKSRKCLARVDHDSRVSLADLRRQVGELIQPLVGECELAWSRRDKVV